MKAFQDVAVTAATLDDLAERMSEQESRGFIPLAITVATATLAPLVVFFCLVITTTDGSPRRQQLPNSQVSGNWSPVPGRQGAFNIGAKGTGFTFDLPPDAPRGRMTFDLYVHQPIEPSLHVVFWTHSAKSEPSGFLDLSQQVRRTGWNKIVAQFDDAPGFFAAEKIQIAIVSPAGANIAELVNVELESFSFSQRCAQAWSRLFRRQPLAISSINFINSSRIAGRGVTVVFWAGFFLATVVLLARRFVLRRRVSLLAHTAVTVVVLVVLADLRNSVDYARHAHGAVNLRAASANVFEYLNEFESQFPWFTPTAKFLTQNVTPGQSYFFDVRNLKGEEKGVVAIMARKLGYYAQPAQRTDDANQATFALVWARRQATLDRFQRSEQWRLREVLPGKMFVFERNK